MATYIGLATFTDQGMRTVKDTVKRADAVRDMGSKMGVEMKDIHWTLGAFDIVAEFEARDDAAMVSYSLAIASAGNVRFQSLRALNRDEMAQVVSKMP